jgi:hypothetical protein
MATIEREQWSSHRGVSRLGRPEIEHVSFFSYGAEPGTHHAFFPPCFIWRVMLPRIGYLEKMIASRTCLSASGAKACELPP